MRNISFSLTTPQFRAKTKTVTRRMGWANLKAGDKLMGCEKCMGRKKGEPLVRLGEIEVVSARREPLKAIFSEEDGCAKEGFPDWLACEFVNFFCDSHKGCFAETIITRIEFRYTT